MRSVWNDVRPVELRGVVVLALGPAGGRLRWFLDTGTGRGGTAAAGRKADHRPGRRRRHQDDGGGRADRRLDRAGRDPLRRRRRAGPGAPFVVHVAVLPAAPAPLLRLDVTAAEGLVVLSPEAQITREKVTAGSAVPLEVRALSAEAGSRVLYVKATLELPDGPQARTFAFPILVGPAAVPAAAPAKAAPPAKSAH